MDLPICNTLNLHEKSGVLHITLNRPEVRNAMNLLMVSELKMIFTGIQNNLDFRAVVLRGAGGYFCAGGDIKDMAEAGRKSQQGTGDLYYEMNREFGRMITLINSAPQAVIAVLEGPVLGGGFGIACVSDVALARHDAQFGLPETGLGLPPAQIAPFVVQRIGLTQARRLGVLGARFNGEEAKALGVVHQVCQTAEEMETALTEVIAQVKRCGPHANAVTKKLMLKVGAVALKDLLDEAARDFSKCIQGPEAKEGTMAFISKRLPSWAEEGQ